MGLVSYLSLFGALCWCALLLLPWRPWSTRERLEAPNTEALEQLSDITVLIPARNECECIEQTLNGLWLQGRELRIIVIDDQSSDDTAHKAKMLGALVIAGTAPPLGWSGKLWALEQGLKEVSTAYTLLLDADIQLAPGIVSRLRQKACDENLALVSLARCDPAARMR